MSIPEITEVEQRVLDEWEKKMPGVNKETHLDLIRKRLKSTAYHEAGHAIARAFFGDEYYHFSNITAIPSSDYMGKVSYERVFRIDSFPLILRRKTAMRRIIFLFGGPVAQSKVDNCEWELEEAFENSPYDYDSEQQWREVDDIGKSLVLAEHIVNRAWPPMRTLIMLGKWTKELFEIPVIWQVTASLAARLINQGEISSFDEFDKIASTVNFSWVEYPTWKRRFLK